VNNWAGTSDSVPDIVVALVRAGSDGASAISYSEDVWEWFGVTVPVERDFLSGHALKTAMVFLLWKYGRGYPVGLRVSSLGESRMLRRWMGEFGKTHIVLEFDEVETCSGFRTVKIVSLGMFAWAVRCGILGEGDSCEHLGRVGSLLFQLVGLCHGLGLVDVTVTGFMRYLSCSLDAMLYVLCVQFIMFCFWCMVF
jgi:hypothetical protein